MSYYQEYYQKNKEAILMKRKLHYIHNFEHVRQINEKSREKNKERYLSYCRKYYNKKKSEKTEDKKQEDKKPIIITLSFD